MKKNSLAWADNQGFYFLYISCAQLYPPAPRSPMPNRLGVVEQRPAGDDVNVISSVLTVLLWQLRRGCTLQCPVPPGTAAECGHLSQSLLRHPDTSLPSEGSPDTSPVPAATMAPVSKPDSAPLPKAILPISLDLNQSKAQGANTNTKFGDLVRYLHLCIMIFYGLMTCLAHISLSIAYIRHQIPCTCMT